MYNGYQQVYLKQNLQKNTYYLYILHCVLLTSKMFIPNVENCCYGYSHHKHQENIR